MTLNVDSPGEGREVNDSGRGVVVRAQEDWGLCRNKAHIHSSQQLRLACLPGLTQSWRAVEVLNKPPNGVAQPIPD